VIKGDSILFFGGATSGFGFGIQNTLRTGIINPDDPTDIEWSISTPDPSINGYRMAAALVYGVPHWIGGSNNTYNYDGLAYDNSGGVSPNNRVLGLVDESWVSTQVLTLPMDLRGIAMINDSVGYLAGGMLDNQQVTDKIYKLAWNGTLTGVEKEPLAKIDVFPNPFGQELHLNNTEINRISTIEFWTSSGVLIKTIDQLTDQTETTIHTKAWPQGLYVMRYKAGNIWKTRRLIKK